MAVYIVIFCLVSFCSVWFDGLRRSPSWKGKWLVYWGLCLVLTLVAALRFRLGVDTIRFGHDYSLIHPLAQLSAADFRIENYDPGYVLLASLLRSITPSFLLMQAVCAVFINFTLFRFFRQSTSRPFLAVWIYLVAYFLPFNMEIMRASIAIGLFLLAWPSFRSRRWWLYYLLTFAATLMHFSAFILLFLPILRNPFFRALFRPGWPAFICAAAMLLIGWVLAEYWTEIFAPLGRVYWRFIQVVDDYKTFNFVGCQLNWKGIAGLLTFVVLYPVAAIFLSRKPRPLLDLLTMCWIYITIISINIPVFGRFAVFFIPAAIALVSDWAFSPWRKGTGLGDRPGPVFWLVYAALFMGWQARQLYSVYEPMHMRVYQTYVPYSSVLNPFEDPDREEIFELIFPFER